MLTQGVALLLLKKRSNPKIHTYRRKLLDAVGVLIRAEVSDLVMHLEGESMFQHGRDSGLDIDVAEDRLARTPTFVVRIPLVWLRLDVQGIGRHRLRQYWTPSAILVAALHRVPTESAAASRAAVVLSVPVILRYLCLAAGIVLIDEVCSFG